MKDRDKIQKDHLKRDGLLKSGRQDSNLRPPAPKAGALTGLRYAPIYFNPAVTGGFEPPIPVKVCQFSKLVVSATHPRHRVILN